MSFFLIPDDVIGFCLCDFWFVIFDHLLITVSFIWTNDTFKPVKWISSAHTHSHKCLFVLCTENNRNNARWWWWWWKRRRRNRQNRRPSKQKCRIAIGRSKCILLMEFMAWTAINLFRAILFVVRFISFSAFFPQNTDKEFPESDSIRLRNFLLCSTAQWSAFLRLY